MVTPPATKPHLPVWIAGAIALALFVAAVAAEPMQSGPGNTGAPSKGLPAWVPVYPRATPKANLITPGSEPGSFKYILTFTTPDAVHGVIEFYRSRLTSAGFAVKQSFKSGNSEFIALEQGKHSLQLTADNSGKETTASMIAEEKK